MLEDDLRSTLRDRAAQPAVQPDLLDQVRGGIRRSNRRRAAVAGAAAVIVAAIAVPFAFTEEKSPPPVAPAIGWPAPQLQLPAFPFTPSWVPPGPDTADVGQLGPNLVLSYEEQQIQLEVGPVPGSWEMEGEEDHQVALNGTQATVRTGSYVDSRPGDRYVGIRWRLADGRWVQLNSFGPAKENDMLRFARGLREQPVPASPPPVTVAAAPPGLVVQQLTRENICLAPPAALSERDSGRGICVSVEVTSAEDKPQPEDEKITLNGRPAWISEGDDGPSELTSTLTGKRTLTIYLDREDVPLTREELIRFAEGVAVKR
ncbi:hypothetical protein [Actinoplanes friuliensis]|uniref:Uncharacterized protein n=1 Tax=Actinoplanes friuliensis DSM 7358 TaxID=1246995 RepID=U5W1K7_9ACTN|nr:hypothetical protein [Actinoplanes friuliensis]AGZ43083.1 hypothetical protein AFR_24075 [Actinoplanes friuliensis DSM 7358]